MKRSAVLALVLVVALAGVAGAAGKIVSPGDFFPSYRFDTELPTADSAYLGIADKARSQGYFMVDDLWGEVLVLELFNRFCFGCQQAAPVVNRVYELVASDPALSTKVRFLGVGVGNNRKSVDDFRREFNVPFPLVPDPLFGILDALGNPGGTPYTMILRRTSGGLMLMTSHFGVLDSAEEFVEEIRMTLEGDVEQIIAAARPAELPPWVEKELVVPMPQADIENRVIKSMERAGYGSVGLYSVNLPDGDKVYVGESARGKVFTRVISRLPVCDVCHPVHFLLTVNAKGQVVDFDAIFVTKYWNKEWTPEEVDQMRRRLLGLSVFEAKTFDPEVDAVSTATMSSALIFDSLRRTGPVMEALRAMGKI
ncbi:MAG: hypothetical protein JSV00_04830 [bacterium]|nr:MAG: hypothetical protein JSV00_04830 [bacterium]